MDKTEGPLGGAGKWEIYPYRYPKIEIALSDDGINDWMVVGVRQEHAQHLRDFARNLERAADYLEGK